MDNFDSHVIERICFSCDYNDKYQLANITLKQIKDKSNVYTVTFIDKDTNDVYRTVVQFDQQYHVVQIEDQVQLLTN